MTRLIFHIDLDAFFASVEEIEQPELHGKPVIVGGKADGRGVVASANYAARKFGVRSAMPTAQALRRCPQAVVVPPRHALYKEYSQRVMAIFRRFSPVMEQISIDEAFLDMTGRIPGRISPEGVARRLQQQVETELGLSASVGIAANKLVAKIASDFEKPHGITYVPPGTEAAFLFPLPVRKLWGVGPKTAAELAAMGVETIGQLAQLSEENLVSLFGSHGAAMFRHARGLDDRPVQTTRRAKSISQETTFREDVSDAEFLRQTLAEMSRKLSARLQKKGVTARTVTLKLRYSDFSTVTRSITHDPPTDSAADIARYARFLLERHWQSHRPLRLVGVGVSHLVRGAHQPKLFET